MTEFSVEKKDDILIITVNIERATLEKAKQLKDLLIENISESKKKIILDCGRIKFMDSTFLGAMIISLKKVVALNGDLRLIVGDVNTPVWIMFETTRMFKVFKSYKSVPDAINSFQ
ncbi:MAG: STAS domain-containing protein [Melioribacteraceae bacterium]|nr:STAS domain-containing protein [Melioribacteraceae bacterium]